MKMKRVLIISLVALSLLVVNAAGEVTNNLVTTCYPPSSIESSNSYECMGNGQYCCTSDQKCACKCNPGWKGSTCSTLDLLPIPQEHPGLKQGIIPNMGPNWGAGVVYVEGYYHAFVGSKTNLAEWASDEFALNHGILHLRSPSLANPQWENLGELKNIYGGNFGFRVDIKRHPQTGGWVLLTEGYAAGDDRYPSNDRFGFIMLYSDSINGPWIERVSYKLGRVLPSGETSWQADPNNEDNNRWDCRMADPTFVIMPNTGETYIAYRGTKCCCDEFVGAWGSTGEHEVETIGLLRADSWEGPFERLGVKLFEDGSDNEDAYMWYDSKTGGVHMIMHSQNNSHYNHERRGSHAYSPQNGMPFNWKLSSEEAWDTFLYFDNCLSESIVKRQRPSLIFDPETGNPKYLLTGIATTEHGLEWGDGWTAFQPLNAIQGESQSESSSLCTYAPCEVGSVFNQLDGCETCKASSIPYCLDVTSSSSRDRCICSKCTSDRIGELCQYDATLSSSTCPNEGWKVLPGENNGKLFRCGNVVQPAQFDESTSSWVDGIVGGWYGHCVPVNAMHNFHTNCGDNSDENSSSEIVCPWPFIRKADGLCKECENEDVTNCVSGQVVATDSQDSCICQKCVEGWIGSQCDIQVLAIAPTENPVATLSPTKSLTSPPSANTPIPTFTPTKAPTKSPTVPEGCYSINFKDCLPAGYEENDGFCNKIWLPNGAQNNCVALGGECTSNPSSCCGPAECFAGDSYASCLPPSDTTSPPTKAPTTQSPTSPPCITCDDREPLSFINKGKDCTTVNLASKCTNKSFWINQKFCQLSCYNAGLGYDGDICCNATL